MKFLKMKFQNNVTVKIYLLATTLFVLMPTLLFAVFEFSNTSYSNLSFSNYKKLQCSLTIWWLFWLHIGLLFTIPLTSIIPWKKACIVCFPLVLLYFILLFFHVSFHDMMGGDYISVFILYNAYNSIYLLGIKGCAEAWNRRKNKSFFWAIFLTSPLLIVLGLTLFVGFFVTANCIYPFFNH